MTKGQLENAAAAVARIPSCVAVLTAVHDSQSTGMLASWIQQVSFEPLMISVGIKRSRPIHALIEQSSKCVVNILGEDDKTHMRHFGKGFEPDQEAFDGIATSDSDYGVRLDGAISFIECSVENSVDVGDHLLLLCRVVAGNVNDDQRPFVHIRKTATNY